MIQFGFGFGFDSNALKQGGGGVALLPIQSRIVAYGDSNYEASFGAGIFLEAVKYARGVVIAPRFANQAVAGYTTTQAIANYSTKAGSVKGDILTLNLGRNDLYAITEANQATIIATVKANILSLWATALADGYKRIVHNTLIYRPVNGTSWTSFMEAARLEINAWLRLQDGSQGGVIKIADLETAGFDYATDSAADGQHLNNKGADKFGRVVGAAIRSHIVPQSSFYTDPSDFGSIITPASRALAGTGGTVLGIATGVVADGCNVQTLTSPTGVTVVASKGVDEDGFNEQIIELSGTATESFVVRFGVPITGTYAAGNRSHSYMRARLENIVGMSFMTGGTYIGTYAALTAACDSGYNYQDVRDLPSADVATQSMVANQPSSSSALKAIAQFRFGPGPISGKIRLSRPTAINNIAYP